MLATELPTRAEDLTIGALNRVIAKTRPDVALADFEIIETNLWGCGNASSAGRHMVKPVYTRSSPPGLPTHLAVKVAKSYPGQQGDPNLGYTGSGQLYANEVNIYNELAPASFLESAVSLGGAYDPATKTFVLLLEDLRERGVVFKTIKTATSIDWMRSVLEQVAALHARYWGRSDFETAFAWLQPHTKGDLHDLFTSDRVAAFVRHQVSVEQFKQEMLERAGVTTTDLHQQFQRVQAHQATLAPTICHGDLHIGNTYILPDGSAGLIDWQLASRGYCMHDVSYVMATGLAVADRRTHERDLLAYYRTLLIEKGVREPPSLDALWLEYRRAMAWNVYIGWLITPVLNYGWDVTLMAHLRLLTAYEDLETRSSIDAL